MIEQLTFPSDADATVGGLVNYNPNSPKPLTRTWLYEPLIVRNNLTCEETPWLATKSTWEGGTKLTLDIREGSSGATASRSRPRTSPSPSTSLKQYPAIDKAGVWNDTLRRAGEVRDGRGQQGRLRVHRQRRPEVRRHHQHEDPARARLLQGGRPDEVRRQDARLRPAPSRSAATTAAGSSSSAAPTTGRPTRSRSRRSSSRGNYDAAQAALKLRSGQLDAYWGEIPNPKKTFVDADPKNNHFYYAPNGIDGADRQRREGAVQRRRSSARRSPTRWTSRTCRSKATYGIMKPASQTGLKLPSMADAPAGQVRRRGHGPAVRPRQGEPAARRGRLQEGRRRQAHQPRRLARSR